MEDNKRFSVLRPLTSQELKFYTIELINFFNPLNNKKNREYLGLQIYEGTIRPLKLMDFFSYIKQKYNFESLRFKDSIVMLVYKLINANALIYAGSEMKGSPPLCNTYYSMNELTNLQSNNQEFWLGKILGTKYLRDVYEKYIVRIEGEDINGVNATGSGILIDSNIILTCGHNLNDITNHRCFIGDMQLEIIEIKPHCKYDIGIIKTQPILGIDSFPYFGQPKNLDKTLTLGYPPLRGMREATLIAQSGEINAIARDILNIENITISSITRPGNSGGPVISEEGYIVGIVVNSTNSVQRISCDKETRNENISIPFYNAISSNEIGKIIKEIDSNVQINYENYE